MKIKKKFEIYKNVIKLIKCVRLYMLNFNASQININNYNKRVLLLLNSKI